MTVHIAIQKKGYISDLQSSPVRNNFCRETQMKDQVKYKSSILFIFLKVCNNLKHIFSWKTLENCTSKNK